MNCLNCDAELTNTEGKRERKFCNSTCRSSHWFKHNRVRKVKVVPIKEWNELQERLKQYGIDSSYHKPKDIPKGLDKISQLKWMQENKKQ